MPVDNNSTGAKPGSRLRELGLGSPEATAPFGSLRRGVSGRVAALFKPHTAAC